MSNDRDTLERELERLSPSRIPFGQLARRRDRRRRNQRIAAGVVGVAIFVAAVWIVTSVGSLDRSETSVGPAGDVTGPAETGPAETGPTVYPVDRPDAPSFRIPPAGTAVSTPVEGKLIAEGYVGSGYVVVYADGRVLSWEWNGPPCGFVGSSCLGGVPFVERRLSPEGVERVRSGVVQRNEVLYQPESAWEDREDIPYVPARYSVCWHSGGPFEPSTRNTLDLEVEAVLDLLPASAQALLSGSDPALHPQCLEVTPEEARSLEKILSEAGSSSGDSPYSLHVVGAWLLRDGKGDQVGISIHPLFPDGRRFPRPGF